ncbi:hypothetical protein BDP27DRAFT_237958 [Rhodocollybia butyracea]|uniref:Uncharacterized protein n=1 Tax=Rhodocollybia butyracea TaxID=206335 RepID=A0A9P5U2F7_9AGAR|nr:hypothetical protein BDP27DRAFT_237958 [Rhodocollybia butyracea]
MASHNFFENSSKFIIRDSEFSTVGRDLVVNQNHYYRDRARIEVAPGKQFPIIHMSDIYLLGTIARYEIQDSCGSVQVTRTVRTVKFKSDRLTMVTYEGPNAKEDFEDDVLRYSQTWSPNLAQLYGITEWNLPAMIFHDELIPYAYLFNSCISRPIAHAYLMYRYLVDSMQASLSRNRKRRMAIFPSQHWMQPASGLICLGPNGPRVFQIEYVEAETGSHEHWIPALTFQAYASDEAIVKHIENHFKTVECLVAQSAPRRHEGSTASTGLDITDTSTKLSFGFSLIAHC